MHLRNYDLLMLTLTYGSVVPQIVWNIQSLFCFHTLEIAFHTCIVSGRVSVQPGR